MLKIFVSRTTEDKIIGAEVVTDTSRLASIETRWDWKTLEAAKEVAAALGPKYIATDAGKNVSPRYDVIELPKIGTKVSKTFNGDHYPCGIIVKISKSLKCITTDGGEVFYRVRQTGSWRNEGTWFLEEGHHSELNPSF